MQYREALDTSVLGTLLFGLRPAGVGFSCNSDPRGAMQAMYETGIALHLHANGDRFTEDGERRVEDSDLRSWVDVAVALAPTEESAAFVRKCIDQALGPFAWLSDEDLVLLRNKH